MYRFITLIFSITLLLLFKNEVALAAKYEEEPNNDLMSATEVSLNETYIGNSHYYDRDYYKIELKKAGQIVLTMKNHSDFTWDLQVKDTNNKTLASITTTNGNKVTDLNLKNTTRTIGLPAGVHYIFVEGNGYESDMGHIDYELDIQFNEGNTFDLEPNNDLKSATEAPLNNTYKGNTHYYDPDYYKIELDQPRQIVLTMKNHPDFTWDLQVKNTDNKTQMSATTTNGVKVTDLNFEYTTRTIGLPAGVHYIFVEGNGYESDMGHIDYELAIQSNQGNTFEQESNNDLKSATEISLNNTYTGNSHYYDPDYYKIKLDQPKQIVLTMKNHPDFTWDLQVRDVNGKAHLSTSTINGAKVTDEGIAYTTQTIELLAGVHYIFVEGNGYESDMGHISYSITVSGQSFYDVDPAHWAFLDVEWAKTKGLIGGYPNGSFKPSGTLTEAETAAIFSRYFNINAGGVLSNKHWAQAYYDTLHSLNIPFKGFANDKIKNQPISRGLLAQVIHKSQGGNGSLQDAVQFMIDAGLTTAKSYNDYKVNSSLTRAEAATFFHRLNQKGFTELKR